MEAASRSGRPEFARFKDIPVTVTTDDVSALVTKVQLSVGISGK